MFRHQLIYFAIVSSEDHLPTCMKHGHTFKCGNTITLQQPLNTLRQVDHHFILLGNHRRYISCNPFNPNTDLTQVVSGINKLVGGLKQRLGRDTANVQAGPAIDRCIFFIKPLFYDGSL